MEREPEHMFDNPYWKALRHPTVQKLMERSEGVKQTVFEHVEDGLQLWNEYSQVDTAVDRYVRSLEDAEQYSPELLYRGADRGFFDDTRVHTRIWREYREAVAGGDETYAEMLEDVVAERGGQYDMELPVIIRVDDS